MLRITTDNTDRECLLKLEGCLCGPWVMEVAVCWLNEATASPRRPVRVDLSDVFHVDRAGRELITLMYRAGVRFVASGFVIPELVTQIAEAVDSERRSEPC